jgi:hypothetical protein
MSERPQTTAFEPSRRAEEAPRPIVTETPTSEPMRERATFDTPPHSSSPVKPYQAPEHSPMSELPRVAEPAPTPYAPVQPREPVAVDRPFAISSQPAETSHSSSPDTNRSETPTPASTAAVPTAVAPRETPVAPVPTQAEPPRERAQTTLDLPLSAPQSTPSSNTANPQAAPPTIASTPHTPVRRESDDADDKDDSSGRKSDNAA